MSKLTNALQTRLPSVIVSTMYNVTSLKLQFKARLLQELHAEQCKRKKPSILRKNKYPDMVDFSWDALLPIILIKSVFRSVIVLLDVIVNQVESQYKLCNVSATRAEKRLENLFTNVCVRAQHRLQKCIVFFKVRKIL